MQNKTWFTCLYSIFKFTSAQNVKKISYSRSVPTFRDLQSGKEKDT